MYIYVDLIQVGGNFVKLISRIRDFVEFSRVQGVINESPLSRSIWFIYLKYQKI
jgi:hypothetical protein